MKNNLKTIAILMTVLAIVGNYGCSNSKTESSFSGTTLHLDSVTVQIPKSYKQVKSDSGRIVFADSASTPPTGTPPPPGYNVSVTMDSVVVGPPPPPKNIIISK